MTAKRIATLAAFTAIALVIHVVESLIPLPLPIPGVKLGLANAVTLFLLFAPNGIFRAGDAPQRQPSSAINCFAVLLCRIFLGALIVGRPLALIYSLAGGLLAVTAQIVAKRFVTEKQIWVCGAFGAVLHNAGQVLVAAAVTGAPAIVIYLPALIIAGVVTGVITGFAAQLALGRIKRVAF